MWNLESVLRNVGSSGNGYSSANGVLACSDTIGSTCAFSCYDFSNAISYINGSAIIAASNSGRSISARRVNCTASYRDISASSYGGTVAGTAADTCGIRSSDSCYIASTDCDVSASGVTTRAYSGSAIISCGVDSTAGNDDVATFTGTPSPTTANTCTVLSSDCGNVSAFYPDVATRNILSASDTGAPTAGACMERSVSSVSIRASAYCSRERSWLHLQKSS